MIASHTSCQTNLISQNSLAGGSGGERKTDARVDLGPEVASVLPRTLCQAAPVAI